jgi:hypothetical protein
VMTLPVPDNQSVLIVDRLDDSTGPVDERHVADGTGARNLVVVVGERRAAGEAGDAAVLRVRELDVAPVGELGAVKPDPQAGLVGAAVDLNKIVVLDRATQFECGPVVDDQVRLVGDRIDASVEHIVA